MKKWLSVLVAAGMLACSTAAMADIGFQFGVPYMLTSTDKQDSGTSGSSVMLTFDLDQSLVAGVMYENIKGTTSTNGSFSSNLVGLRLNKHLADAYYLGLGLGTSTIKDDVTAASANAPVADVLAGLKFYPTKGKGITTFCTGEVGYRVMKTTTAIAGNKDFSGIRAALSVGVGF